MNFHGRALSPESGSAVIILVGIILVLLGSIVFMNSHNTVTANQLATARSKVRGDALASHIHNSLKQLFISYPANGATCLPPALNEAAVKAFRKYGTATAAPIVLQLKEPIPAYPCLYDEDDRKLLTSVRIEITEMTQDAAALSRNLSMTVDVGLVKARNTVDQTFHVNRDYRLRVLSLSQFGVIFHANPADGGPFVQVEGSAKVRLQSTVLYGDEEPPSWSQVQGATGDQVIYARNAYARFPHLGGGGEAVSVPDFRVAHPYGIQTGVLAEHFVADFLPNGSSAGWNHKFDYSPLYNGVSYAIPEIPGQTTAGNCLSGSAPPPDATYDDNRASVTRIPDVTNGFGPHNLKQTCAQGSRSPAFLFFRAGADLTIDFDPSDSNFCGIVVANRLIVNIPAKDPVKYGLIGHFFVRSLVVRSADSDTPAELRVYNPEESEPLTGLQPLPAGQSLASLADAFKKLSSASAWNLYVPIASAKTFQVRAPADYLQLCTGSPSYYAYKATYQPIQFQTGFTDYQNDAVGAVYSMEAL